MSTNTDLITADIENLLDTGAADHVIVLNESNEIVQHLNCRTFYAIDFETYYDDELSVTTMGVHNYVRDPRTEIYMVAICGKAPEPFACVGSPQHVDWGRFKHATFVAHNAAFDKACFDRLEEQGIIPDDLDITWVCSADLVAHFGLPRGLKDVASTLFNEELNKSTRQNMKGVTYEEARAKGMEDELKEYCLRDAEACWNLWEALHDGWNKHERKLSHLTREMSAYGVAIDTDLLAKGREKLGRVIAEATTRIPWAGKAPLLSHKALREKCAEEGIEAPASLAEGSEACSAWEEKYGDRYPWVAAMRDYRKANALDKKLAALENRLHDGNIFSYGLKYCGAHTGRWSGDAGFNIQNLPRGEAYGVNLRSMIVPRPGHVFIISDLAQIEQRVLSWLAGDEEMLRQLTPGTSVYEAHARTTMGYTGEGRLKDTDPDLYRLAKARVLGLGYGAGAVTFQRIAKKMAGLEVSQSEAQVQVTAFRQSNPKVTALWDKLGQAMRLHAGEEEEFVLPLPSGNRVLRYYNVANTADGLTATVQGRRMSFFGGKLTENVTSATARDVLADALLRLDKAGYRVVMHVHDEVVVEVPVEQQEQALREVHQIMTTTPDWMEGLPLEAETIAAKRYTK